MRIIICNVPMGEKKKNYYKSNDPSLTVAERMCIYPINAFLEKNMKAGEEYKILLLAKKSEYSHYENNVKVFEEEFAIANEKYNVKHEIKVIDTDFEESKSVHQELMGRIVDEIEDESTILADITYGPKDLPIIAFSAMSFAENFLDCEVDNIVYGQADFENGNAVNHRICDMVPLFYLNSITNTIHCDEPNKARKMLKSLLSF